MARLARVVVPGVAHPVTQRGNRRQQTFFTERAVRSLRGRGAGLLSDAERMHRPACGRAAVSGSDREPPRTDGATSPTRAETEGAESSIVSPRTPSARANAAHLTLPCPNRRSRVCRGGSGEGDGSLVPPHEPRTVGQPGGRDVVRRLRGRKFWKSRPPAEGRAV